MATSTERSRRRRAHQRGDHGLCVPGSCEAVTPVFATPETGVAHPEAPRFGTSGQALWAGVFSPQLPALHRQLLLEACRLVDRMDRLNEHLEDGTPWLEVEESEGRRVEVVVDKALAEARQHATALKQLVEAIHKVAPKVKAPEPKQQGGSGVVTNLLSRIDRGA